MRKSIILLLTALACLLAANEKAPPKLDSPQVASDIAKADQAAELKRSDKVPARAGRLIR